MSELDEVLDMIEELKESERYIELNKSYKLGNAEELLDFEDKGSMRKWMLKQPRNMMEEVFLTEGITSLILSRDTIKFTHTQKMKVVLIIIYAMDKPGEFTLTDFQKIYNIYERVLTYVEDFDKHDKTPPATKDFHKKIKKIKWDKEAKKAYKKIEKRKDKTDYHLPPRGIKGDFGALTSLTAEMLIAASAAGNGHEKIQKEDVFKAYKTFIKLLNTNISEIGVVIDKSDEELQKEYEDIGILKDGVKATEVVELAKKEGAI